jgi:hypothetical protein
MDTALPDPFPAARYRLACEAQTPIQLPEFAGSALRGVFGHALKALVCVTAATDCRGCALYRRCPYPALFETPPPAAAGRVYSSIPPPFVVEPPPWGARHVQPGQTFELDIVLIGPAIAQLPLVLQAWRRALAAGLGPAGGRARLVQVRLGDTGEPLPQGPAAGADPPPAAGVPLPPPAAAPAQATLDFTTPLRLKRQGRVLGAAEITPAELLLALVRRSADIAEFHLGQRPSWDFGALRRAALAVEGQTRLQWLDWSRWSNRQQQHMALGGAVGHITLRGDLRPFWPLLHLGQWLHVGGKATFGLGRYHLLPVQASPE